MNISWLLKTAPFGCIYAYVCMLLCVWVWVQVRMYGRGQRSTSDYIPQTQLPFLCGRVSDWPGLGWVGWACARNDPPSLVLGSQAWLFVWVLGIEHRASCLYTKYFPNWGISSTSQSNSWLRCVLGFNQGPECDPHSFHVVYLFHLSVTLYGPLGQGVYRERKDMICKVCASCNWRFIKTIY